MSDVDDYLADVPEPGRSTLTVMRAEILRLLPGAEEGLSYGMPVFRVGGKAVAGIGAAARHLVYVPHSGSVLPALAGELEAYSWSKGALRFDPATPLPTALLERLVTARLAELGRS